MKRFSWWYLFVIMFVAMGVTSCGSDSDGDESGVGPIDPGAAVDDPVGTVELSMMKGSGSNKTYLGNSNIYINDSYNFTGATFVSLGKVNGLGNVSHIPTVGWASSVAVNPGYGYVAYSGGTWYRIYVVGEIGGTSGGVIGYKIEYQTPFKGIDEAISFEQESLTFDADGGTANVLFKNKYIVPFTIKMDSDVNWCRVQPCSSYDEYFLTNGISVTVDPTKETQKIETTVTITTLYGKTAKFKVIRSGSDPYAKISLSELTIESSKQDISYISVSSNCTFEDLNVTSSASWCKAKLVDTSAKLKTNKVKFIGDEPVSEAETRAANESSVKAYKLHLEITENLESDVRIAEIVVKPKTGKLSSGMVVTQKRDRLQFNVGSENVFEVIAGAGTTSVGFNASTKIENLQVVSDASWCTPVIVGYGVRLTCLENSSEKARNCKITLSAKEGTLKEELTVKQRGGYIKINKSKVYLDRNLGNQSVTLDTEFTGIEPSSDALWCTFSYNSSAKILTIRASANTGNERVANVSFKNSSAKIKVIQSKYAVGDTYNESGVNGLVKYMQDSIRLVASENLGQFAWSTEMVATGATDGDDGRKNMEIIRNIPNWKVLYPAFAAVETLNTGGVTGWYLPAYYESDYIGAFNNSWSSSEYNVNSVYNYYNQVVSKSKLYSVIGVYRF